MFANQHKNPITLWHKLYMRGIVCVQCCTSRHFRLMPDPSSPLLTHTYPRLEQFVQYLVWLFCPYPAPAYQLVTLQPDRGPNHVVFIQIFMSDFEQQNAVFWFLPHYSMNRLSQGTACQFQALIGPTELSLAQDRVVG